MSFRTWFYIILIGFCAYGAWGVFNETVPAYRINEFIYVLYMIAPWVLLYGSIKSWHQCFVWRRMLAKRQTPPVLSRGHHRTENHQGRTSILERICALLFILAIAAILKQFSITHIEWWIGSIIMAYFAIRMAIKGLGSHE